MNRRSRRFLWFVSALVLSFVAVVAVLQFGGIRFNHTKSVALGFYITEKQPIAQGRYVLVCPPDAAVFELARERGYLSTGFCPNGTTPLLKKVAATHGQQVTINDNGVWVDGQLLPFSKPVSADPSGRPMPKLRLANHFLMEHELLLIGDISERSFDSRYFGFIDRTQVQAVVRPLWTW